MMQGQGNMRIVELLRFLYQQTDENHPVTVSDMISYLNEKRIQAVRQTSQSNAMASKFAMVDCRCGGGGIR